MSVNLLIRDKLRSISSSIPFTSPDSTVCFAYTGQRFPGDQSTLRPSNPTLTTVLKPFSLINLLNISLLRSHLIGCTAVPWEFSPNQSILLGLPLFLGLRVLKNRKYKTKVPFDEAAEIES